MILSTLEHFCSLNLNLRLVLFGNFWMYYLAIIFKFDYIIILKVCPLIPGQCL